MRKFQYVPKEERNTKNENKALMYSNQMMKSNFNQYGCVNLIDDYQKILNDGCIYLPNYFCQTDNLDIFNKLKLEVGNQQAINWSKHMKYENPEFSETFNNIVMLMAKKFNVKVVQTRLNYYHNGLDYKPFHHDSNAYGNKIENFTMGASFGDSRELVFLHDETQNKFTFPQNNGDIFAFNKEINKKFMHGVPNKQSKTSSTSTSTQSKSTSERFSIIAWGTLIE